MTNNEILKADLLDILFEHRNKSYGAYVLRRYYNNRLTKAMGIALSVVLMFFLVSFIKSTGKTKSLMPDDDRVVKLTQVEILKPKEPELPPPPRKQPVVSQVKDLDIRIVRDDSAEVIPDQKEISENVISDKTMEGAKPDDLSKAVTNEVPQPGAGKEEMKPEVKFTAQEEPPSFPGGPEALALFFSRNLSSPTDLEAGEKKVILVRFVVGADGSITKAEVVQSGGDEYDSEVLRAFKRMPRWNPAIQNGIKVATSFTQPVTFVGVE